MGPACEVERVQAALQDLDVPRRLRGRPPPERGQPPRDRRHAAARVGRSARGMARAARPRRRRGQRKHAGRRGVAGQHRSHGDGAQHVWRPPGPMGCQEAVERLVGSQPAVPPPRLRAHASRARAAPARGRNDLHLRYRWHGSGARACTACRRR
jgi:hypothetical protein